MFGRAVASGCIVFALLALPLGSNAGVPKSADKVKASVTATKIDGNGTQVVTVILDISKDWHLYANPVNNANFEAARTRIKVSAKDKVKASINYPVGKIHVEDGMKYDIYESKTTILVNVQRTPGDSSPLQIIVEVSACNDRVCLMTSKINLQVP